MLEISVQKYDMKKLVVCCSNKNRAIGKGTANLGILHEGKMLYNYLTLAYLNCMLIAWCLLKLSHSARDHSLYK